MQIKPKIEFSVGAFAAGLAATLVVSGMLAVTTVQRDRVAFEAAARDAQGAILDRVETSIALLRGTAGLFAAAESEITVDTFRRYVSRLALREQYPGILGIGYSRRVDRGQLAAVEAQMRAQGHAQFRVWPEHEREEWHSIVYLEPLDLRNRAAIGFDMYTNETRREAMARARDQGTASASGVVELVQEIDERKQPGFLIYLPVYRGGGVPSTLAQRRERLLGFAYSPIRAVDFLSSAFTVKPAVGLAIYHGTQARQSALLYSTDGEGPAGNARHFESRSRIDVAGQPWLFVFRSQSSWVSALALPLASAAGGSALSLLLAILVQRQHSARKQAQSALERERAARSEAERANVMKDEFLATLSHELRTPLSAIVGWAELLRRGGLSQDDFRRAVEVLDRNAKTQARLIEDLLDMNRIISGKMMLDVRTVDMDVVVADAIATLGPAADARGVRLQTVLSSQLSVRGDPARLQQIVWNLVANAIKFTPRGGRVQVTLERSDSKARLTVADTGEGIDPEVIGKIFDRFVQADGAITRRHGGLGLGLAIVRQLVQLHGGHVYASSGGRGTGATFVVEMPLMIVQPPPSDDYPAVDPGSHRVIGLKVLVVEDEPDARDLMRRILGQAGVEVHCAASALEALDMLPQLRPDVLLSDIGMPGMDGYEMMRKTRALPATLGGNVPAAAITAYARDADRLEALRAGFQTHLVKPIRPDELLAVVEALSRWGNHSKNAEVPSSAMT